MPECEKCGKGKQMLLFGFPVVVDDLRTCEACLTKVAEGKC
jgi:hypothetical protein